MTENLKTMKTGKCLFVKSATAAAISILLAASPAAAGPVGINFQDSNTGGAAVTNTAFGIDPANWLNLAPGGPPVPGPQWPSPTPGTKPAPRPPGPKEV